MRLELLDQYAYARMNRWEIESHSRARALVAYLGDYTAVCRVLGRYKMYVDTRDMGFGSHLLLDGFWEPWITKFLATRIKDGMTVVDVGANHGYYTILAADLAGPTGKVAAFEPNPRMASLLRDSINLNGFWSRATVFEVAAGSVDGTEVRLFVPLSEPKNAHIVDFASAGNLPTDQVISVVSQRVTTALDGWPKIDVVKIDVEGAEESVLEGLFPTLERDRPDLIVEFAAARCSSPRTILERLEALYGPTRAIDFNANLELVGIDEMTHPSLAQERMLFYSKRSD